MGAGSGPLLFWIPDLVLFPGGTQRRERLGPGVAVVLRLGGLAAGAVTRALVMGGIYLLDLGSIGAVNGNTVGLV